MKTLFRLTLAILCAGALFMPAAAQEKDRDIFNYAAQKSANVGRKIVFIADTSPHGGPGNHEFMAGAIYMARTLNSHFKDVYAVVHPHYAYPKDLSHADSIIVLLNHGGSAAKNAEVIKAVERGAGFAAIHYGVEVNKGVEGNNYLKWIGGYFEVNWSVNPHWIADIKKIPEHEITRGVKPFAVNDEWYYHMRFVDGLKGVTPILSAVPTKIPDKKTSARGGNPDVHEAVKAGKEQHLAWAYVRPDGARGFGFTGYHNYNNLQNDSFRTVLLNAVAWTSKLEIPSNGVSSKTPTKQELDELFKEALRLRK